MAIDYQQILMEMNRPQRRKGSALKKMLVMVVILGLLAGGGYAAWRYELPQRVWRGGSALIAGWFGDGEAESVRTTEPSGDSPSVTEAAANTASALRSENATSVVPRPNGPIDVASAGSVAPSGMRPSSSSMQQPVIPQTSTQSSMPPPPAGSSTSLRPSVSGVTSVPVPANRSVGPDMSATPVLSDTRAQMKVIDQMLSSNPAEAMRRLDDLLRTRLEPDDASEAGYRVGYAARMLRDEEKAEKAWKETAEKYPALRGGRFAALALADTWYHKYAGTRAQISYWDDIQLLYSQALGQDDAPFLPENIKAGVKANLNRLNDALFFGSAPTKLARYHKVESGELLGSIANKYRVDFESIARINGINPNRIRVGMDLKLIVGEVSIVVRKNEGTDSPPTLTWFLDGRWMREYPTCVGDGIKTPAGTYSLTSKERDPSWTNPLNGQLLPNDHPDNILGSRWMAMKGMNTQGLGIHGTTVIDSVPGYTSAGCVRLLNRDVEELFSYARIGNKVTILD